MISSETFGVPASADQPACFPSADAHALKQAFLRGAGIAPEAISADLTPDMMELLGKMMATCLQANIDLLSLRAQVKQEVQADVTTVLVRNNNPLKFFADSQTVLTQMLRKKMPGFMEPLEALDDAASDLRGHHLGVLAGARAGMQATLSTLAPGAIESALAPSGLIEKMLPSMRTQRWWSAYRQRHADAMRATEAQLFGPAFLAAYEAAVEQNAGQAQADRSAAPRSSQP